MRVLAFCCAAQAVVLRSCSGGAGSGLRAKAQRGDGAWLVEPPLKLLQLAVRRAAKWLQQQLHGFPACTPQPSRGVAGPKRQVPRLLRGQPRQ